MWLMKSKLLIIIILLILTAGGAIYSMNTVKKEKGEEIKSILFNWKEQAKMKKVLTELPQEFRPPEELKFVVDDSIKVENQKLTLSGRLINPTPKEVKIMVIGLNENPFYMQFLPNEKIKWIGPLLPPAPPPPAEMIIPAKTQIKFSREIDLEDYDYEDSPTGQVEWQFMYWTKSTPKGTISVILPEISVNSRVEKFKKLGRERIIQLAAEEVRREVDSESNFKVENFDQIKVMASEKNIYVTFSMPFRYVPLNSSAYYGVYVSLTEDMMSCRPHDNREDEYNYRQELKFFVPTKESKKAIALVINAINQSGKVGSIDNGKLPENDYMIIRDKPSYYGIERVSRVSKYVLSFYKIDKISGKIYDATHEQLAPLPEENNEEKFEEIKD